MEALKPYLTTDPGGLRAEKDFSGKEVEWTGTLAPDVDLSSEKRAVKLVMGEGTVSFFSYRGQIEQAKEILQLTPKPGAIEA